MTVVDFPGGEGRQRAGGSFFAVDRRAWATVCGMGMNPAVAYLVLAAFTGYDQRTTRAGVQAVEKYTGMSRLRAKPAIEALETAGLITPAAGITRKMVPAHEVPSISGPARQSLTALERDLWDHIVERAQSAEEIYIPASGRGWPVKNPRQAARDLEAKGWLTNNGGGNYTLRRPDAATATEEPDWIWLPNTLVVGAGGEVPPIELLRQTQDPMAMRLLVDLYHSHSLVGNRGIHWRQIRQEATRVKVGERGPFVVWGFRPGTSRAWLSAPFVAAHMTGEYEKDADGRDKDKGWSLFWDRWRALENLGLVEFVGHLVENDTDAAEVIHPYGYFRDKGEDIERTLANAAHEAGRAMVTDGQYEWACNELGTVGAWLAPVVRHIDKVQMVGIARLKYRPRTLATAEWLAELQTECADWSERYEVMRDEVARSKDQAGKTSA